MLIPTVILIQNKETASRARINLRAREKERLPETLRWLALNWIGVGLDLKQDNDHNYLDEFLLTYSFLEPSPYPVEELQSALSSEYPDLSGISFATRVTGPYVANVGKENVPMLLPSLSIGVPFRKAGTVHYTSGTLGAIACRSTTPNQWLMLSSNHILYLNGLTLLRTQPPVLIPSPCGLGGVKPLYLGTVREFPAVCLMTESPAQNPGDYGIGDVDDPGRVSLKTPRGMPPLLQIAPLDPNQAAKQPVAKIGATTAVTTGIVSGISQDFTVIDPTLKQSFDFSNQVKISPDTGVPFSGFGDSGSLVVTSGGSGLGLVFADSDVDTMISPLALLFSQLGLQFVLPPPNKTPK